MFGDSATPLKVILTFTDKIDWEVIEKDNNIDFEKDQTDVLSKTKDIRDLQPK